jgi:hypothetical protein
MNTISDITAVTVSHNTRHLLKDSYESIRKWHPDIHILIIDGSDISDPCREYAESLASKITTVGVVGYNIGHGRGMDAGIRMIKTKFALIFDTDIVMLKSPVEAMLAMMEEDTYGVGYTEKTGFDGFEYGSRPHHTKQGYMKMLHPYFALLQVANYFKFHPFCHHGAPWFKSALDIHNQGLTDKIIKEFPGLGHSSGKGWVWTGEPREYIKHDTRGTRDERLKKHLPEIEGGWDYVKNSYSRLG